MHTLTFFTVAKLQTVRAAHLHKRQNLAQRPIREPSTKSSEHSIDQANLAKSGRKRASRSRALQVWPGTCPPGAPGRPSQTPTSLARPRVTQATRATSKACQTAACPTVHKARASRETIRLLKTAGPRVQPRYLSPWPHLQLETHISPMYVNS